MCSFLSLWLTATLRRLPHPAGRSRGQGLVEYTLILALVVVVCIAAITLFGTNDVGALLSSASSI